MYKGLTQRAKLILTVYSQEEAKRFRSDQLLPEHILLAIIKEGEGIGFKVLKSLKINPIELQLEIEKSIPRKHSGYILGDVPLSRRGTKILENSAEEARALGHEYIGTELFFLASVKERGSILQRFLGKYSIGYNDFKKAIISMRGTGSHPS